MARFAFEARDRTGRVVRGTREAGDAGELQAALAGRGLSVTQVRPAPGHAPRVAGAPPVAVAVGAAASPGAPAAGAAGGGVAVAPGPPSSAQAVAPATAADARDWTSRANAQAMSLYFRQMNALLHAGSSLGHALAIAARHDASPSLRRISERASRLTASGTPWSETMRHHPGVFSDLMIGMVEAAEASGKVEHACRRLAEYCERDYEIQQTIKRETWYPKILIGASVLIPSAVPMVLGGSGAWWAAVRSPVAFIALVWAASKAATWVAPLLGQSKSLAMTADTIKLSIPVVAKVTRSFATAKLCRALGASIGAGVPINRAMTLSANACDNAVLAGAVEKARAKVLAGDTLTGALSATRHFPPVSMQMLAVGEASGNVEEQLDKVADFLESNAETAVKQAVKLGCILVFLVVAMYIGSQIVGMYTGTINGVIDSAEKL